MSTSDDADWELDVPFEPVGSEPLATGNVTKCAAFWRTSRQESNRDGLN